MSLNKKTVDDINVKGKRVLVRCDFNVPLKNGEITDETRINAALPTIQKLINDGGKVILCSHLGKVKNGPNEGESLAPVAKSLSARPRGLRARGCGRHRPYREWPRRLCHIPVHRPGSSGHPRALDQALEVCGFPPRCAGEPDRCPPCAGTAMMLYFRFRSLCFPLLPSHRGKGRPERSYTAGLFRQYVSGTGPCLRAVVTKNPPLLQQSSGFWDGRGWVTASSCRFP